MKYFDNGTLKEIQPKDSEDTIKYNEMIGNINSPIGYSIITNESQATKQNVMYLIIEKEQTQSESESESNG